MVKTIQEKLLVCQIPQLPENWTIENLLTKHPSKPYNPDIANALFRSGYQKINNTSDRTASRDLENLVSIGFFKE